MEVEDLVFFALGVISLWVSQIIVGSIDALIHYLVRRHEMRKELEEFLIDPQASW